MTPTWVHQPDGFGTVGTVVVLAVLYSPVAALILTLRDRIARRLERDS